MSKRSRRPHDFKNWEIVPEIKCTHIRDFIADHLYPDEDPHQILHSAKISAAKRLMEDERKDGISRDTKWKLKEMRSDGDGEIIAFIYMIKRRLYDLGDDFASSFYDSDDGYISSLSSDRSALSTSNDDTTESGISNLGDYMSDEAECGEYENPNLPINSVFITATNAINAARAKAVKTAKENAVKAAKARANAFNAVKEKAVEAAKARANAFNAAKEKAVEAAKARANAFNAVKEKAVEAAKAKANAVNAAKAKAVSAANAINAAKAIKPEPVSPALHPPVLVTRPTNHIAPPPPAIKSEPISRTKEPPRLIAKLPIPSIARPTRPTSIKTEPISRAAPPPRQVAITKPTAKPVARTALSKDERNSHTLWLREPATKPTASQTVLNKVPIRSSTPDVRRTLFPSSTSNQRGLPLGVSPRINSRRKVALWDDGIPYSAPAVMAGNDFEEALIRVATGTAAKEKRKREEHEDSDGSQSDSRTGGVRRRLFVDE